VATICRLVTPFGTVKVADPAVLKVAGLLAHDTVMFVMLEVATVPDVFDKEQNRLFGCVSTVTA
jgi:hypothetical protein